jgi:hypothetical protein
MKHGAGKTVNLELEFPVDPTYAPMPAALSVEGAAQFIEQLRRWFPHAMESEQERLARKVNVEFVL